MGVQSFGRYAARWLMNARRTSVSPVILVFPSATAQVLSRMPGGLAWLVACVNAVRRGQVQLVVRQRFSWSTGMLVMPGLPTERRPL